MTRVTLLRAALTAVLGVALVAPALAQPSMHEGDGQWLVWSQHRNNTAMRWRVEAGPFSASECRAALKKASGFPAVGFTKWYDITPANLEKVFGQLAPPSLGTWVACWPVGFDFDRDLVDK